MELFKENKDKDKDRWQILCPKNCFKNYNKHTLKCPDGKYRTFYFCSGCDYQIIYLAGYLLSLKDRIKELEKKVEELSLKK